MARRRFVTGPGEFCDILAAIMRTTLEIDDDLMTALLARHPGVSKREAVEQAIRSYLQSDAISRIRALAGTLDIEDVSEELRRIDRHA